jgi:hypothetical protein
VVSSLGSLISLVSTFILLFILWEAIACGRLILFVQHATTVMDAMQDFPSTDHTYNSYLTLLLK